MYSLKAFSYEANVSVGGMFGYFLLHFIPFYNFVTTCSNFFTFVCLYFSQFRYFSILFMCLVVLGCFCLFLNDFGREGREGREG